MAVNKYILGLQDLRRQIENRIDNEIEDCMKGRGNSEKLKDSLEYILEQNVSLSGIYKEYETKE